LNPGNLGNRGNFGNLGNLTSAPLLHRAARLPGPATGASS
jgi:hypothetical protein